VVPAHNEKQLLPACLRSILAAAVAVPVPVRVVVALDRCTDRTAEIAASFGAAVETVAVPVPGVGAARATGVELLLESWTGATGGAAGPDGLWIANTDADTSVPADWLARQLQHAEDGAEAVIGTVRVLDWSEQPATVAAQFQARYRPQPGHRHIHGANLSFSAAAYLAAGGFTQVQCDEDTDLICRLQAGGSALVWAADLPVVTSARKAGRAPAGFAAYLAGLGAVQ
jgi:glycosyltransferase involved in cell wall biosynthesis